MIDPEAAWVLARLRESGFTVRAEADKLYVTPRADLSAEQLAQVQAHKADLLTLLGWEAEE